MSTSAIEFAPGLVVQGFQPPLKLSAFKLIAFDMDSTLINICLLYTSPSPRD